MSYAATAGYNNTNHYLHQDMKTAVCKDVILPVMQCKTQDLLQYNIHYTKAGLEQNAEMNAQHRSVAWQDRCKGNETEALNM